MHKFDIDEVRQFIMNSSDETKVYIGSDSERFRKRDGNWYANYTTAIVVHKDGNKGCRVFGYAESERDYDQRKDKPRMRLMNEVMRTAQMYLDLEEAIGDKYVEIHLDINASELHGSSCVLNEAIGYIKGMCNIVPMVKPEAFAASFTADRLMEVLKLGEAA